MIDFDLLEEHNRLGKASIKVIGVGGAGGNTINSMIDKGLNSEIEFIAANTDAQALMLSKANHKIQLGVKSTKGLGTGANPEIGRRAAEEDLDKLLEVIGNADIVFLAAGMGGGTGSGAAPVIAKALRERNILTIAVVTKPFIFEGRRRSKVAYEAVKNLRSQVDTLLIVPNQRLLEISDNQVSMIDAFALINDVLDQSVRGISNIITKPGHINVDFADLCTIMRDMGLAVMGTGKSSGEDRARKAANSAISSPLLENMSIKGAKGVLLNITGGKNLGLHEINEAASVIYNQADEDANIILGSVIDESMTDEIIVTIVATGFDEATVEITPEVTLQATPAANVAPANSGSLVAPIVIEKIVEKIVVQAAEVPSASVVENTTVLTEPAQTAPEVTAAVHVAPAVVTAMVSKPEETLTKKTLQVAPGIIAMAPITQPVNTAVNHTKVEEAQVDMVGEQTLVQEEQALAQAVDVKTTNIDINDLDVPTFLREKARETQDQV
jgi:cell division protein FtsZ